MEIIPAIDLRGGRCVRLHQGDFSRETVFAADPVAMARHWRNLGARRLHVIDLDGAAQGKPVHVSLIGQIVRAVNIPVQVGGGLRQMEAIENLLLAGVARAILGTVALEDPALVKEACHRFGEAILVSLDAREGRVATHGWQEASSVPAAELMEKMASLGVRRFIYTDIARDGTLTEPNFEAIAELKAKAPWPLLVAGGISSLAHLEKLAQLGMEGAILGRAIYTGHLDLREALALEGQAPSTGN